MRHVLPWPRPLGPTNCRVNGVIWDTSQFSRLVWDERVFVDKGPSPAGNSGPYLHVYDNLGDDARHRVYPEPRLRGKVEPVKLADGSWAWAKLEKAQ